MYLRLYADMSRTVAIIDDNASERLVVKGLAEESGLKVIAEGANGEEAVAVCKGKKPDLVIMDVKMPVMDGVEAAARIARECPTPVILLTASDDEETVRRAVGAGVFAFLVKPVRFESLLPAAELAVARFEEFSLLRKENAELKGAMEARKTIEKAKGLLMEKEGITEAEAFARIRRISMDKRKTMKEVAEVILLALEKKEKTG